MAGFSNSAVVLGTDNRFC